MLWLVQAHQATPGKSYLGDRTPSCFLNFRTLNIFLGEGSHLRFQIVANEIEFVAAIFVGRVECSFCWRQGEDQPAMPRIDGFESENVAKECTVRFSVFCVDDCMSG